MMELDKAELLKLSDDELGQHVRYQIGESEYVADDAQSEDDMGDTEGQDIENHDDDYPMDMETGLPKRLKIGDIDKMDDGKLGKMMRAWIKYRLSRKGIDLVVFGKEDEDDIAALQDVDLEFADSGKSDNETYTLKDVAIFATGEYKDRKWTLKDLKTIFSNFGKFKGQITPPLALGHREQPEGVATKAEKKASEIEQPAAGWVSALRLKGSKLYADITDIPKQVFDLFVKKAYKRISAEIYTNFKDGKGNTHGPALAAVVVLGKSPPAIKSLPEIQARYDELAEGNEIVSFESDLDQELVLAYLADEVDESADTEEGEEAMTTEEVKEETTEDVEEEETEEKPTEEEVATPTATTAEASGIDADIKKQLAENAATIQKLSTENDAFRQRVQQLETDNQAEKMLRRHTEEKAFVEKLKEAGKILPANEEQIYTMFNALADVENTVKLTEKDAEGQESEVEKTAYDLYRQQLETRPAAVDFSEHGKGTDITAPGGEAPVKASSGEPRLQRHEKWDGNVLHDKTMKMMKEQPDQVKEFYETHDECSSLYEAAMDIVQA